MAVASAMTIVSLKEKGHFEHKNENERIDKYTVSVFITDIWSN